MRPSTSGAMVTTYARTVPSRVHGAPMYAFHMAQPAAPASAAVARVISTEITEIGDLCTLRAVGSASGTARTAGLLPSSALVAVSDIGVSVSDNEDHR